ncbi:MAG: gamma-butyrobetaine dioxygenase [Streptosporangiaceae bacterium]|nr:phosphonate degradation operons associated domain protein [Streptosporangiaceae bacterium]MDX6429767.1 gamma-butyrobetaine dioxygenase [Streptosporangiaceae bacterium]
MKRQMSPLDTLAALFAGEGAAEYFGEEVTQAEHMLQAAALAEAEDAPAALTAAALLHDVGHFTALTAGHGGLGGAALMAGTDNRHSHTGADRLARWFGPAVTEPVRLHVAAKRYLCAVEPNYFDRLSAASTYTLQVQGGPMTADEATAFADGPYAEDAVRLRRWDEAAKDPAFAAPDFEHFRPMLAALLRGEGRERARRPRYG